MFDYVLGVIIGITVGYVLFYPDEVVPVPVEVAPIERKVSLPEKCHPFYLDGTGRWAECMGVGPG
jgi:hypothetical protein